MQRRKTLINSLVNSGIFKNKDEAKSVFEQLGFDLNVRGENLTIQDFNNLTERVLYESNISN